MSALHRAFLRLRRFLGAEITRVRRVPEAIVVVAAAAVVLGVIRATASGADWPQILRNQAINIVSATIIAVFAYVLFLLRFRRAQLSTYLGRQRARAPLIRQRDQDLSALATTIVDELLDTKPPHAALVIGPADVGQVQLLAEVTERLADKRRVPVDVDLPSSPADAALPSLVRDRFVDGLVGSFGDAQSGRRLYSSLVRRRRVVALVRGLDQVGHGEPLGARRGFIARILESALAEGIMFVGWVHEDLAPSISEVAALRTRPLPRSELVAFTTRQLQDRGLVDVEGTERALSAAFNDGEMTRDPILLSVAADLTARRLRAGETADAAVVALFADPCAFRRQLAWLSEWALDCTLDALDTDSSPASLALAAIGKEAHYRQEAELSWDDASAALDTAERRRFSAGVAMLTHRGVLDVTHVGGTNRLLFRHPAWAAFAGAIGLRLDPLHWSDLLRPHTSTATLDALTGALFIFGGGLLRQRSFLHVLRAVGLDDDAPISLEMALSVITALQSSSGDPLDLAEDELAALQLGWSTASDVVKMRFVSTVNFAVGPLLVDFLWRQVVPPAFSENTFRVRRAICARLGASGAQAWERLGQQWCDLIDAAITGDLSSWGRTAEHWRTYGFSLASLGWTLPGALRGISEQDEETGFAVLATLRELVGRRSQRAGWDVRPPEIGLEISLAEGFKIAAGQNSHRSNLRDERWRAEAAAFLDASTSWISKQALLQAVAIELADGTSDRLHQTISDRMTAHDEHPFVREAAALILRTLDAGKAATSLTERDIWLEDAESLDDGGVDLSREAHRLLGLTTFLINLAEWPFRAWLRSASGSTEAAVSARERAFTSTELPKCFLRSGHAATMFETACDCSFGFCGPQAKTAALGEPQTARRFSRSFLQRAQATASARSLIRISGGKAFAEKALAPVWRALDEEMAKEQHPHLSPRP